MKTADFIKTYCIGTTCPDFDACHGCLAYDGEECDEAFCHPLWHGMKMADRVIKLCEKEENEKAQNEIKQLEERKKAKARLKKAREYQQYLKLKEKFENLKNG